MKQSILKPLDYGVILLSVFVCISSVFVLHNKAKEQGILAVTTPNGEFLYQLDKDDQIELEGRQGMSVIQIQDGCARFTSSPCTNQTCVASSPVKQNGEWAACMPNGIFIRVQAASNKSDIDITSF